VGQCFKAPVSRIVAERPAVCVHSRECVVLRGLAAGSGPSLSEYQQRSRALADALKKGPGDVLETIAESQMRGRGGAGFLTGKKWRAAAATSAPENRRVIVANADEGDSGAYIDRFLMECDPHSLIEGMTLAAYAVGAAEGWIYLRHEYPIAKEKLEIALQEARAAGLLGPRILGSPLSFDIQIAVGHGSYVCGEETALLTSLEGRRPEVMARPPYATQRGLFGRPTVINNVETFATIPWIVERGGAAYRALGFSKSRGTKVLSLNSLFRRPGLYEVEFGMPVRTIVEELGGGLRSGILKGVVIGGPLAGIIPPSLLDTPLGFEELQAIGAAVGHGGVLAFDEHTSIVGLLHHIFSFGAYESCGKCTPCRLGTARLEQIFAELVAEGATAHSLKMEAFELLANLSRSSLCGHGTGLAEFAASALRYYGKELEQCWK
jgi:formate dehydrogenase iron-sulfur subunit